MTGTQAGAGGTPGIGHRSSRRVTKDAGRSIGKPFHRLYLVLNKVRVMDVQGREVTGVYPSTSTCRVDIVLYLREGHRNDALNQDDGTRRVVAKLTIH
jgi:hypothetical protein